MKQGIVLITVLLLGLCGCSLPDNPYRLAKESMVVKERMAVEETRQNRLPTGTATREDCALCGSKSIWSYYRKLDSIGVLNLAKGDISDLRIFEYEDDGTLKDNSEYTSMMGIGDGNGRYGHMMVVGGRGICNLSLSWEDGREITLESIAPLYCPECMSKIAELDKSWVDEFPDGRRCPYAMIDFLTGEIYSLNGISTTCFIRDYYMKFEFGDRKIDGVIVYAPERFQKE